jgi:hypothetical protein
MLYFSPALQEGHDPFDQLISHLTSVLETKERSAIFHLDYMYPLTYKTAIVEMYLLGSALTILGATITVNPKTM